MRCRRLLVLALILALAGAGCTGWKQPHLKVDYYTLEYDPPAGQGRPLAHALRVERFQVSPLYNGERIAFRQDAYSRGAYDYHRWRSNPGDLIAYFLARDLRAGGLFRSVDVMGGSAAADVAIAGCVEEILEIDHPHGWEALLTLTITLVQIGQPDPSRQVLMQKQYRSVKACEQKHPRAVVAAISQAMAEVSPQIIADIYKTLTAARQ